MKEFDKEEFLSSLNEDVSSIFKKCKFLFVENNILYVVFSITNEELQFLRSNWKNGISNALAVRELTLKPVSMEEEKVLFLEKAIEMMKAKEVKISLA